MWSLYQSQKYFLENLKLNLLTLNLIEREIMLLS